MLRETGGARAETRGSRRRYVDRSVHRSDGCRASRAALRVLPHDGSASISVLLPTCESGRTRDRFGCRRRDAVLLRARDVAIAASDGFRANPSFAEQSARRDSPARGSAMAPSCRKCDSPAALRAPASQATPTLGRGVVHAAQRLPHLIRFAKTRSFLTPPKAGLAVLAH